MSHDGCLAILLGSRPGHPEPSARARQDAAEHAAQCSDCWTVLRLLHELSVGTPPPGAERMPGLFGCEAVQDQLYLLADLPGEEIRTAYPEAARHLAWCHACRERAAEVFAVERAAVRGDFGTVLAPPPRLEWRETVARAGEAVRELVGRVVIEARRAGAVFTELPAGMLVFPMPAPAGALRGPAAAPVAGPGPTLGQRVRFALGETGAWAELGLESEGDRVRLALTFSGGEATQRSVHLRELRDGGASLVARHSVRGEGPLVVRDVRPGRYMLEVREQPQARRFHLRFDVEPSV